MKRVILILASMGVAILLASGVALAATFVGDAGPNLIVGTAASDSIFGQGGDDALHGGGSADAVYGGFGDDLIRGGPGNDNPGFAIGPAVKGLYGGFRDDRGEGNLGDDLIVGGAGGALLLGGFSDDQIGDPGPGALDKIICGAGVDFVEASPGDFVAFDCERVERP